MASELVAYSREADSMSIECEQLPVQKHVFDERTYQKFLGDRTEANVHSATYSNSFTNKGQPLPPGASYVGYPYDQPSDSGVSFQSNSLNAPQSSINSSVFRSPAPSLMGGSMEKGEQFYFDDLPRGGDNRHVRHDEGKQHLLSRGEKSEMYYTSQPSSYNRNASHTVLNHSGPQDGRDKMVFYNNSTPLQELDRHHTTQHTHVYGQPHGSHNSKLRMDAPTTGHPLSIQNARLNEENGMINHNVNSVHGYSQSLDQPALLNQAPLDTEPNPALKENPLSLQNSRLNQENGGVNYNIDSINGQSVSMSHTASLNHGIQTKQLTRGNPLSLRNNHLNQQNGEVNESISAIQEQPMGYTSSFQQTSLPSQHGYPNQQNGDMGSHSSQSITMEVNRCTSIGQAPSETELRQSQKTRNPMSLWNSRLNQENTVNQTVAPHLVKGPAPLPGRYISLYRDQGDQESGNVPSATHGQHESMHGSSQKLNGYGGQGSQGLGDIPFHKQNHEIIQGLSHGNMPPDASGQTRKKVFILHFTHEAYTLQANPVLRLASCLARLNVDVTLDLFENDSPPDSWPLWYEHKINESNVVLCIITEGFYDQLTSNNNNHVLGYSVYNLMNGSKNIAFRAVFIDADKRKMMEHVPPAIRGATSYSLDSNQLTPHNDEFANLYAFLTGQNRVKKPELGNMIKLPPKTSRCELHV